MCGARGHSSLPRPPPAHLHAELAWVGPKEHRLAAHVVAGERHAAAADVAAALLAAAIAAAAVAGPQVLQQAHPARHGGVGQECALVEHCREGRLHAPFPLPCCFARLAGSRRLDPAPGQGGVRHPPTHPPTHPPGVGVVCVVVSVAHEGLEEVEGLDRRRGGWWGGVGWVVGWWGGWWVVGGWGGDGVGVGMGGGGWWGGGAGQSRPRIQFCVPPHAPVQ